MVRLTCAGCGKRLKFDDRASGKSAKCPRCGHSFRLPTAVAAEATMPGAVDTPRPAAPDRQAATIGEQPSTAGWRVRKLFREWGVIAGLVLALAFFFGGFAIYQAVKSEEDARLGPIVEDARRVKEAYLAKTTSLRSGLPDGDPELCCDTKGRLRKRDAISHDYRGSEKLLIIDTDDAFRPSRYNEFLRPGLRAETPDEVTCYVFIRRTYEDPHPFVYENGAQVARIHCEFLHRETTGLAFYCNFRRTGLPPSVTDAGNLDVPDDEVKQQVGMFR